MEGGVRVQRASGDVRAPAGGGPLLPVSGILLSGGHSRRMGRDKASLTWRGRPFAHWVLDALGTVSDDVLAVRRPGQTAIAGAARTIFDRHRDAGPLAGLEAGLLAMHWECAIVCPVDAPLVRPDLLRLLARLMERRRKVTQAVVPVQDGRPQPLTACYHRSAAAVFGPAIAADRLRVLSALDQLRILYVPEEVWRAVDPDGRSFAVINTPEEYARWCAAETDSGPSGAPPSVV